MQEVSSQGFGTVQSTLAEEGLTLPSVQFEAAVPGETPPSLDGASWLVPFTAQHDGDELDGFVLLPDAEAAPGDTGEAEATDASSTAGTAQASERSGAGASKEEASDEESVEVSPAAFSELGDEEIGGDGESGTFELLADVDLEVRVELGRRELPLADVLKLTTGSVVELEKMVGEPLSVYANGRLIAEGEAVVIDEQFGVRITNLASEGHREKAFF
jgi:flagellar motor switch protein FliN/FliY